MTVHCRCVKLWSPTAHDHIATLNHDATVTALQLSNFLLITASLTGGILLWNLETKSILFQMRSVGGASLTAMSMSAGKIYGAGRYEGHLVVMHTHTNTSHTHTPHTHTHTQTDTHTHTHTHNTRAHAHIHTHMHTHTPHAHTQ